MNVNSELMCARGYRYVKVCVRLEVSPATGLVRNFRINPHAESVSVSVDGWVGEWCILDCKWVKLWSSGETYLQCCKVKSDTDCSEQNLTLSFLLFACQSSTYLFAL